MRLSTGVVILLFCIGALVFVLGLMAMDYEDTGMIYPKEDKLSSCKIATNKYDSAKPYKCPEGMTDLSFVHACALFLRESISDMEKNCIVHH